MKRIAVLVGFLIVGFVAAIAPPGRSTEAQANCFQETSFCITTPQFADYFAGRGGSKTLGFPIFMSESPARLERSAPCRGQHSAQVLHDVLGCSEDEITALADAGVIA